ncbi:MAG: hypothetical protein JWM12_644 [Ilumatobacteraceae bacterium]|nr:hypothetical protein [Ilumatobacteraceae bacterium]
MVGYVDRAASVAIIGGGPRGVGVLERLVANVGELAPGVRIDVHVIDPHPPGGGKVWRFDQSPLLRLNSMAADVTMFTDETVRCAGPILPGPTMAEWGPTVAPEELSTPELAAEAAALRPTSFPTRRLGGDYLSWIYRRAVASAPEELRIIVHAGSVVDVRDCADGQLVVLDDGSRLRVDAAVLTLGHLDTEPSGEGVGLTDFAARHDLSYLPPAHGTEEDLSVFRPGADVIMRGFGLGFVDLLVLLTEGRGGRYVDVGNGSLRYEPSGEEPRFHVGSRRGVPYHAKLTYEQLAPRPPFPKFFTREAVAELAEQHEVLSFRRHAWPLMAKELEWAGYHELALGHPDRVSVPWPELEATLAPLDWGTAAWRSAVAAMVPDPVDRIDFVALDRPLAGLRFDGPAALEAHVRDYIRADIDRRADQRFSADLGVFNAFLAVFALIPVVLGNPQLSARSRIEDFDGWWFGFFSSYASGPPPRRLEELLALNEAGVVHFLGADTWVRADEEHGEFVAGSASTSAEIRTRAMIDARLPGPAVSTTTSPLVRALRDRGEIAELVLTEPDGSRFATGQIRVDHADQRVIDASGTTNLRRFALGPHSTSRAPAFSRPRTNSIALRHNDIAARAVLQLLAGTTARTSS